jgi:LacI family transcriptional regulator
VRFIRAEAANGIKVQDVMQHVLGSRRTLEHAFLRHLGHSIHAEITRARIQLTQQMIATTDLPLEDVAARCGFSDRTRLSSIFRRETGLTPKAYRQQSRRGRSNSDAAPMQMGLH